MKKKAAERAGLLSELLDNHPERERGSDGAERVLSAEAQRVRAVRLPYRILTAVRCGAARLHERPRPARAPSTAFAGKGGAEVARDRLRQR
jgi:hypothetical protein